MSNRVFQALALEKIENLSRAYETSKVVFWDEDKEQLIHPGEYGEYREKAVIELLELFIPQNLSISEGFIISSNGDISTQCDIVIYDPNSCPKLMDSSHQKFFPVECVVAIGEIKSNINTTSELKKILNKLSKVKKMRECIKNPFPYRSYRNKPFAPEKSEFDQIYSFVLCKRLPAMPVAGFSYGSDVEERHRHNIVVGIENGHACYTHGKLMNYYYPQTVHITNQQVWRNRVEKELPSNMLIFLSSLFSHCQVATLLELDTVVYLTNDYQNEA